MRRHKPINQVGNGITIDRVSNGWIVTMPRRYRDYDEVGGEDSIAEGMKIMEPIMEKLMKMKDSDPLLDSLRKANEEKEEEPDPEPEVQLISQEEGVYVCKTFQEVLELLENKFLFLDAQ